MVGAKRVEEGLGRLFGESWRVGYDSRPKLPINDSGAVYEPALLPLFGELWGSSWSRALVVQSANSQTSVQASRGLGAWVSFTGKSDGTYAPDADVADRLATVSSGWRYVDAQTRSEEVYDASGVLQTIGYASGPTLRYGYSTSSTAVSVAPVAGLLTQVQDQFGRGVQFTYAQPSDLTLAPHITTLADPAGKVTSFAYDALGNLNKITWPDGSVRVFLYERTDLPWALTGIVDENAARTVTYGYDSAGRAIDTQAAGGVDHYSAMYTTPPSWLVTETYDSAANVIWRDHSWVLPQGTVVTLPNGQTTALGATLVNGMPRLTSQSQPAGSGCSASSSAMAYDGNGNVVSRDDFDGMRSCMAYDASRNLETVRVEGLTGGSSGTACSGVTAAAASVPAGSRKTSTSWHPLWRLATQVAEPGRITTSVYNGQADPFNGGAAASCAPSTAVLPDGSAIAVLCKKVEQATTDVDGHLGFTAALQSGVPSRVSSWTYNQYGQVLTSVDAVGNVTTSAYYADTSFTGADPGAVGHMVGDLASVKNAAGQVTTYDKYDKNGQVLQSTDPNGVVTVNTYDARQRLTSTSVGGQQTGYAYWPTGLLKRVTQPDASYVAYGYDDAHRLTSITDNLGDQIVYTLDNMGNRTGEATKDPAGVLRRQLSRTPDALGRVQQTGGVQ